MQSFCPQLIKALECLYLSIFLLELYIKKLFLYSIFPPTGHMARWKESTERLQWNSLETNSSLGSLGKKACKQTKHKQIEKRCSSNRKHTSWTQKETHDINEGATSSSTDCNRSYFQMTENVTNLDGTCLSCISEQIVFGQKEKFPFRSGKKAL